jgi:S-DNA-T family DNA segregation ATPase FtsK/SpoIIIE
VLQKLKELGTPGILLSGDREEGPLLGEVKPEPFPPGRGRLVTRRGRPRLIQAAWLPEDGSIGGSGSAPGPS